MKHRQFVAALDQKAITEAIGRTESTCSGEVRVHIQRKSWSNNIRSVAERTFERLGMTKTAERNGVLLFICSEEHKFVILGDKGIDEKVGPGFWDEIAAKLTDRFKRGEFTVGIIEAVERVGPSLSRHFPRVPTDVNELSNEISISDHHEESGDR